MDKATEKSASRNDMLEVSHIVENLCKQRGIDVLIVMTPKASEDMGTHIYHSQMPEDNAALLCLGMMQEGYIRDECMRQVVALHMGWAGCDNVVDYPEQVKN